MHAVRGALTLAALTATTWAADIFVPAEYPTIQGAIEAASNGDRIFVAPGTWTGTGTSVVDFRGKQINVRATGDASVTIIDGQNARRCVDMTSGESTSTTLEGFTITRGAGENGGGILIQDSSPMILECVVRSNEATNSGGGIATIDGSPVIGNCVIHANSASGWGGGVYVRGGTPQIEDTTLSSNTAENGGGGFQHDFVGISWDSCTITGNHATDLGGGIFHLNNVSPEAAAMFTGCVISDNVADSYGGGVGLETGTLKFTACEVMGNTAAISGGGFALANTVTGIWSSNICGNTPDQFGPGTGGVTFHTFGFIGPDCPSDQGPCCLLGCSVTTEAQCVALGGSWQGPEGTCADCPIPCPADLTGDGSVTVDDLLNLINAWGPCP